MASLLVASGFRLGESFWLGERVNIIGRGEWASMRILDRLVSEEHAKVYLDPASGAHCICPLDPRNPVYVNGRPIVSDRRLCEEDRILLGNTVMVFTQRDVGSRRPFVTGPEEPVQAAAVEPRGPVAEGGSLPADEQEEAVCGWVAVRGGSLVRFVRWRIDQPQSSAGRPGPKGPRTPLGLATAAAGRSGRLTA